MNPLAAPVAGVLAGSLFLAGMTIGAAVWRLIGRLTGGVWPDSNRLDGFARLAPSPVLMAVVAAAVRHLWIAPSLGPAAAWREALPTGLRLAAIAAAWLWIAWLSNRRPSQALSAAALLLFGLSVSVAAFDMVLSLEPGWVSSAEGMALAVRMLGAAGAGALLLGARPKDPAATRDRRDLAGLFAATLLATAYLSLMSYLIPWYGDLPDNTAWIRLRDGLGWRLLIAASLGAGALLPLPLLALSRRWGDGALRTAAVLALLGFLGQTVWLSAPSLGWIAALVAVATAVGGSLLGAWALIGTGRAAHAV